MPFPPGWPPGATSTFRSIRFFQTGLTTANFSDNAWLFGSAVSANKPLPYLAPGSLAQIDVPPVAGGGQAPQDAMGGIALPVPHVTCRFVWLFNDGPVGIMEVSFDGIAVHDEITIFDLAGQSPAVTGLRLYEDRQEGGLSVRFKPGSVASTYRIIGW